MAILELLRPILSPKEETAAEALTIGLIMCYSHTCQYLQLLPEAVKRQCCAI